MAKTEAAPFITVPDEERPEKTIVRSGMTKALLEGKTIFTTNERHRVTAYNVAKRHERKAVTRSGSHNGEAGFYLWLEDKLA